MELSFLLQNPLMMAAIVLIGGFIIFKIVTNMIRRFISLLILVSILGANHYYGITDQLRSLLS
ncbi:hypothetical protein [Corynebacterium sp. HS2168-gen11]|uniref:hypothetical protein n=1 Tax=Corynebacterium sp. HS2168-gen11 TaxID=2974027 RepID=UPI00216B24AA|nr:hypothetical protein [Corynebacterium sp. HS2168-gen11]MCS4535090.1 hypothetical protein [Corynebacterium sp. HS2168-gen11]